MHRKPRLDSLSCAGFTILELATVIVIIMILATMAVGTYGSLQGKAARAACSANLRSLYAGTASYIQEQGQWPQISTKEVYTSGYAEAWIGALSKYGIARNNWICSSVQYALKGHDYVANPRVDYLANPFGPEPRAAYQWDTQPWFVERGDMHGDGNLMIFANGRVKSLQEFRVEMHNAGRSTAP